MNPTDSTGKPTRTLTYWIFVKAVEQFHEFRKSCAPSSNPSDLFPGINCPLISASLRNLGLIERDLGATGLGTRNTVLQHLRILQNFGLMISSPNNPGAYTPTARADDLYAALDSEGLLPYILSRDAARKLPEIVLFCLLRRIAAERNQWNLHNLARWSMVGEVERVRAALSHIGNGIEVRRDNKMERVRLRTSLLTPTTICIHAEDKIVRDSMSSIMDNISVGPAPTVHVAQQVQQPVNVPVEAPVEAPAEISSDAPEIVAGSIDPPAGEVPEVPAAPAAPEAPAKSGEIPSQRVQDVPALEQVERAAGLVQQGISKAEVADVLRSVANLLQSMARIISPPR